MPNTYPRHVAPPRNIALPLSRDVKRLRQSVGQLYEDTVESVRQRLRSDRTGLCYDLEETETEYVFSFDLPGIKQNDLKVEMANNRLRISGQRKREHAEKDGSCKVLECHHGSFDATFELPDAILPEKVTATYEEGVLKVSVPKQPRKFDVQVTFTSPKRLEDDEGDEDCCL